MHKKCFYLSNLQKLENKTFIYERKSIGKENVYSYKTISQEVSKSIEYLQNYYVKNNVGIAIDLREHSVASCILLLGILNHECHFYCLDFEETKNVYSYLKSSGVKYVISSQNLKPDIPTKSRKELKILNDVFFLYLLDNQNSSFENAELCYTIATSGSTGLPKMVHVPYECIEPNIKNLSKLLNIQGNDMIFLGSPPSFDPFIVEFFVALENGACLLLTSYEIRLQPYQLLEIMFPQKTSSHGVTIYQTTPSLLRLFGKQNIQDVILSKRSTLRCLILGGEDFPSSLELKSWLPLDFHLTGKHIYNIYGITEISCWSSIYEFDTKLKSVCQDRVPLGKSLDSFTFFRLVDEFGNVLDRNDCKAELEIGSSKRFCFIPQYDTDIEILKSNKIIYRKTGDLVERDSLGNIYYIGRTNNTIKRVGKRLCLDSLNRKVETILNTINISSKLISLWHKESSNLIFYFVNSKQLLDHEKELVINALRENLENHEQPGKIFYSNKVPLNLHGKVDHKKILQRLLFLAKSPIKIFEDFLINIMGLHMNEDRSTSSGPTTTSKCLKMSTNLSFRQAGGTSFQALSLATEMAQQMDECIEQRKILEMLLNDNVTVEDILIFLKSCSRKFKIRDSSYECSENIHKSYNLKLMWRCDLKKCIDASPSIYEEKFVAVGSHSHLLITLNAATGEEISSLVLKDRIECPVVFATSQLALVGCYDGFLYGFNFNNGSILWKLNGNGMIKAKPLVIKNVIIIASYAEDYNILAYDLKTFSLIWNLKLGSKGIFSSPVQITEESVLVCSLDGTYALIETATGSIMWCQKLVSPIFSTATKIQTSNETVLVLAEVKGKISICKSENGEEISYFQTEGNVFSGLTLYHPDDDDTNHTFVIFGCHDKNVYCLKMDHRSKQLTLFIKFSLNSAVYATPIIISHHYILACSTHGLIVLFNLHSSTLMASYDLKAEVFSSPKCLNDKYVYVGARDNYLYAFQLEI